ncbi:MAG: hypothetical protein WCC08_06610, partial [Terrimicrobiaceae bacterium]
LLVWQPLLAARRHGHTQKNGRTFLMELQEMTAEAECMAHTAPSVIARCVRGSSGWVERV